MSVMDRFGYNAGVVASIQIAVNLPELLLLASYFGLNSKESPLASNMTRAWSAANRRSRREALGLQERLA